MTKRFVVLVFWIAALAVPLPLVAGDLADERAIVAQLQEPHRILLLRHALAPGIGDPSGFDVDDCATQRNLSAEGRAQARVSGERLRAAGLESIRVFAGPWCRNVDTAALLGFGEPVVLEAMGSVFRTNAPHRERRMRAWREHLADEYRQAAGPAVYVTHRANIMELSGRSLGAGAMLVVEIDAQGNARPVDQ